MTSVLPTSKGGTPTVHSAAFQRLIRTCSFSGLTTGSNTWTRGLTLQGANPRLSNPGYPERVSITLLLPPSLHQPSTTLSAVIANSKVLQSSQRRIAYSKHVKHAALLTCFVAPRLGAGQCVEPFNLGRGTMAAQGL